MLRLFIGAMLTYPVMLLFMEGELAV